MELTEMYAAVSSRLDRLDFGSLWQGFSRCGFALYDDDTVVLDGERRPRTNEFLANTAILFEGRYIAIWHIDGDFDLDVLASKLAHEMFHAHQYAHGESRFPDEIDALLRYEYSPAYLQRRLDENRLLVSLLDSFDRDGLCRLLSSRRARMEDFPYQYGYESAVETIEGAAQLVELCALRALDEEKYRKTESRLRQRVCGVGSLMPARVGCYDTGALFLELCLRNSLPIDAKISGADRVYYQSLIDGAKEGAPARATTPETEEFYKNDLAALRSRFSGILAAGDLVARGDFELLGVNVYSARYLDGYIYTEYFLMYRDGGEVVLDGNYLIKCDGKRITEIYKEP